MKSNIQADINKMEVKAVKVEIAEEMTEFEKTKKIEKERLAIWS